jgi:hypothetical protein
MTFMLTSIVESEVTIQAVRAPEFSSVRIYL